MATGSSPLSVSRGARPERVPAETPSVRAFCLRPSGVHAVPLEEAIAHFGRPTSPPPGGRSIVWFDIVCPGADEALLLRERLGFHPLAVEDCLRGRQRPKVDRYPGYLFLVLYAATINPERNRTAVEELHTFIGEHFIVTVHDHKLREVTEVTARWRSNEKAFPTVGHLAHALLDTVVDSYLPVIDSLGLAVDDLEHEVLEPTGDGKQMQRILLLRREVAAIRRMLAPTRDLIRTVMRRDVSFLSPDLLPYFQDVLDHAERDAEELDSLRDALAATLDAYLSLSANQLNHTLRLMAAWSIVLMAMAWIAGVYGMNFVHMPELLWRFGYAWALGLMLLVGGGILYYFRRRDWV